MLACWEGPSADLLHQNSLMLPSMTVIELDVFSGNMPTCTSSQVPYFGAKFYKISYWKKNQLGTRGKKWVRIQAPNYWAFQQYIQTGQHGWQQGP